MGNLVWSPFIDEIQQLSVSANVQLGAIISAYAKAESVSNLIDKVGAPDFVIANWQLRTLQNGASDLVLYDLLRDHGISLYVNNLLHAKLYVFSDRTVLCGSGNATGRGLGLTDNGNIEAGVFVDLDLDDEIALKKLRDGSTKIDDELYEKFKRAIADDGKQEEASEIEDIVLDGPEESPYLISHLPALKAPEDFIEFYFLAADEQTNRASDRQRFINDICQLDIPTGLLREQLQPVMEEQFTEQPLVRQITEQRRNQESMRFGAVTDFIHQHCRDVPVPYRWEVKEATNTLYNWLCFFFDDLEWHTPGARSQVIYSTLNQS